MLEAHPGPSGSPPPAAVAETHCAVVVFVGDRAYKVKPVDLGFLDFRTVAPRREACHREVRLNRRLAPDVYLGVSDVVGPDGAVCDHLVVMRRMPAAARLSTLVRSGVDARDALRARSWGGRSWTGTSSSPAPPGCRPPDADVVGRR